MTSSLEVWPWLPGSETPPLNPGDVHVWRALLSDLGGEYGPLTAPLSQEEVERARRFHFERDRDAFLLRRGVVRRLLAAYTGAEACNVALSHTPYGKPFPAAECNPIDLRFNLSHSEGAAIFAFTRSRDIGVDIEAVRAIEDMDTLVTRFFAPCEAASLMKLPVDQQPRAFLQCWVRKEAFTKAKGEGLQMGLDTFAVLKDPDDPAALLHLDGAPEARARWNLYDLDAGIGYVAALAVG